MTFLLVGPNVVRHSAVTALEVAAVDDRRGFARYVVRFRLNGPGDFYDSTPPFEAEADARAEMRRWAVALWGDQLTADTEEDPTRKELPRP